jgi:hypothetical protein
MFSMPQRKATCCPWPAVSLSWGAESAASTGEPHALLGSPDELDQQAITWCAALEWRPGEDHTIDRPQGYEFWQSYQADFWPGPQLGWWTQEPETGRPLSRLLCSPGGHDLWTFRRIRYGGHYANEVSDVTLMNWPQMDYWLTPLVAVTDAERTASLAKARELTLCFVHWLQIDAPGPDGGHRISGARAVSGRPRHSRRSGGCSARGRCATPLPCWPTSRSC